MNNIFICQIVLGVSLFGMLFIFLRNLPLLLEFEPKPIPKEDKFSFKIKIKYNSIQKKVKDSFNHWQEKNLRKMRIWNLKIDNFLNAYLDKIRKQKLHFPHKGKKEGDNKEK
jgi:hypothetical protein